MMTDAEFTFAPIRLFASDRLFSAKRTDKLPPNTELVPDLDRAMLLENAHDLPDGYRIWSDVVSDAVSGFHSTAAAQDGRVVIETEGLRIWEACGEFERTLKIKRIRKTMTPFEEFWLTVAYDLFEMLKSVSLGRHVLGRDNHVVLEAIYTTVDCGFYPCGWHQEKGLAPSIRAGWMASDRSGKHAAAWINKMSRYQEIWVYGPNGQSLCALINGDVGWLMYLRYEGDAGFSSRNPTILGLQMSKLITCSKTDSKIGIQPLGPCLVNRRRNGTPFRLPKGTPASGCIGSARVGPELSI